VATSKAIITRSTTRRTTYIGIPNIRIATIPCPNHLRAAKGETWETTALNPDVMMDAINIDPTPIVHGFRQNLIFFAAMHA